MKWLILALISFSTYASTDDIAQRMQDELGYLEQESNNVKANLLDIEDARTMSSAEAIADDNLEDSISTKMAAPTRDESFDTDKQLNITDTPVESVQNLRRRSR